MEENIALNRPVPSDGGGSEQSSHEQGMVHARVLDWDAPLPAWVAGAPLSEDEGEGGGAAEKANVPPNEDWPRLIM
jgi:hypothetical protein